MSENLIDLIILRHGEANQAYPDKDRRLTDLGRRQISSQFQWLKDQGFIPELILHSPYARTVESASLSANSFPDVELRSEPLITPEGEPSMVSALIPALDKQKILMVSHMPLVAYLTVEFIANIELFGYPVAGLCWLQIERSSLKATLLHKHWAEL